MPTVGVVITTGPNRMENLASVLAALEVQTVHPKVIVVVRDGHTKEPDSPVGRRTVDIPRHRPGQEQPRNVGVRAALEHGVSHVWFLDSDIIVEPDALEQLLLGLERGPERRILVAPYEWLPEDQRSPDVGLRNDPRWPMFDVSPPDRVYHDDVTAGLACFGGNLLWHVAPFVRVGGFHRDLYHGRCEDGELGLRAVVMDVPISMCAAARGWHLWHPRDTDLAIERNKRDVPLLNSWHPWVEGEGVVMVDRDGKAFDRHCSTCGDFVPTLGMWEHQHRC